MKNEHKFIFGIFWTALLVLVFITTGGQVSLAAGVIYVDINATGANNGTSWVDAYTSLQPALDASVSGEQIWVAEGTYKPTWEYSPGDPRSASFQMKNGVAIYGGFDPSVGDIGWDDRDWEGNITILSGDLSGDDGPNFANNGENSYHVFYHPQYYFLDSSAILDGFVISGGNASSMDGGGMWNFVDSTPTLTNCTFSGNSANRGGAIYIVSYHLNQHKLTNCTFSGNTAYYGGGGIAITDSSPTLLLTNCTFYNNSATYGGGMYTVFASPILTNCTFAGNLASTDGGGIYDQAVYGIPKLTNSILWGNSPNQVAYESIPPDITYSDIQGGYAGNNNIDGEPLFVNAVNGDFHLGSGSPAIDAGNNTAQYLPSYDFEGDARILDGDDDGYAFVDMGADEFNPVSFFQTIHVGDLEAVTTRVSKSKWSATITVTIHDSNENPVIDATVTGAWSVGDIGECTTGTDGSCSLTLQNLTNKVKSVTFTVTDVTAGSTSYVAADNHDLDGDSDGTSIVIRKPK